METYGFQKLPSEIISQLEEGNPVPAFYLAEKAKKKALLKSIRGICGHRIFNLNILFAFRVIPAQKKRQVSHYTFKGKIKYPAYHIPPSHPTEAESATLCFEGGLVTAGQSGGGQPDRGLC